MNKIITDIILFLMCSRLLYIEPAIEFTLLEIIGGLILFVDFNYKEKLNKLFRKNIK